MFRGQARCEMGEVGEESGMEIGLFKLLGCHPSALRVPQQ